MTATLDQPEHATHATPAPLLNFDVIQRRAGEILDAAPEDITDGALGELFGLSRETISRFRHGRMGPKFETVTAMADRLGLPIDEIRAQGNPSPPRPAAPSLPKPPAGPKPKAA